MVYLYAYCRGSDCSGNSPSCAESLDIQRNPDGTRGRKRIVTDNAYPVPKHTPVADMVRDDGFGVLGYDAGIPDPDSGLPCVGRILSKEHTEDIPRVAGNLYRNRAERDIGLGGKFKLLILRGGCNKETDGYLPIRFGLKKTYQIDDPGARGINKKRQRKASVFRRRRLGGRCLLAVLLPIGLVDDPYDDKYEEAELKAEEPVEKGVKSETAEYDLPEHQTDSLNKEPAGHKPEKEVVQEYFFDR